LSQKGEKEQERKEKKDDRKKGKKTANGKGREMIRPMLELYRDRERNWQEER
jgi:hypothetical protein